jgi:hypothetical protein
VLYGSRWVLILLLRIHSLSYSFFRLHSNWIVPVDRKSRSHKAEELSISLCNVVTQRLIHGNYTQNNILISNYIIMISPSIHFIHHLRLIYRLPFNLNINWEERVEPDPIRAFNKVLLVDQEVLD